MAYALVANTIKSSADATGVVSDAINTTGANLLILALASNDAATENTISDSKSNTWSPLTAPAGAIRTRFFYAASAIVGTLHTFTASNVATSFPAIAIAAFSGAKATSPFDVENGSSAVAVTTIQPGSVSPSENNELLVTAYSHQQNGNPVAVNSGYTITDQVQLVPALAFGLALAYLIQTSAAASNPTWTNNDTFTGSAIIATFKAPSTAPSTSNRLLALIGVGN
jgi:hypothetical protein